MDKNVNNGIRDLCQMGDSGIADIVGMMLNDVSGSDGFYAKKIIDYYQMAKRAISVYDDKKLFDYLRIECQKSYNSINDVDVKTFIINQVDKFVV
ncbi:MAG: hypothetical protein ACP5NV_02455 [Candidatus Woesearchaeota archaeon]